MLVRSLISTKNQLLVSLFLLVITLFSINCASATITTISLEPGNLEVTDYQPDLVYNFTMIIDNVIDLDSYQIEISFNNEVLDFIAIEEGYFMKSMGTTLFYYQTVEQSQITTLEIIDEKIFSTTVSGSGNLFHIYFKITKPESTSLLISSSILTDSSDSNINYLCFSSQIDLLSQVVLPVANFNPGNDWFYVGDSIILDGLVSTGGQDILPDPNTGQNDITQYYWEIDYNNDGTIEETSTMQLLDIAPIVPGEIKVTLTVYAPDACKPTSPDYISISQKSHLLTVLPVPSSPKIDVYTDRGGVSYRFNSSSYGPNELVKVYANVTYNSAPVVNKDVAFYIYNNLGETILVRTIRSDENGIANFSFRLPWPNVDPEVLFGKWSITSVVDVAECILYDSLSFNYGYLNGIPLLDLYTDRGGKGYEFNSDIYGPQEYVTLYSKVTYNGAPVVGKLVLFEVYDNNGDLVVVRTSRSGSNGIAVSGFRIPWPDIDPESLFGKWSIQASVDVAEITATDSLHFIFSYLVEILDMWTTDNVGGTCSVFTRDSSLFFNIIYRNNRQTELPVVITSTMLDELTVPITSGYMFTILPPSADNTVTIQYTIPSWTYLGNAKAYTSLLNYIPDNLGIPYCPEEVFSIVFVKKI